MRGLQAGALALLLAGCNAGPPAPAAKLWTARDFLALQGEERDLGGWFARELLTPEGAPLVFIQGTQRGSNGLTLFPAVSGGEEAAFVITDIWANHPEPWVQPVWVPLDEGGGQVEGVWNVFPVDVDSTFYSPFWRAELLLTAGLTPTTYRSGRDVLSASPDRRTGGIILCPIVPAGTGFADDGTGPREPASRLPLTVPTGVNKAWVDGEEVRYLGFGADRAQAEGQDLQEAPAYFFVTAAGERPLPLAAILAADAERNSLVRRIDVVLPPGAAAFVPANRSELKALLEQRGLTVPVPPAALDAFPQLALRVVTDPTCFTAANFPASCTWLDTPEKVAPLAPGEPLVQVQLAIGVVKP